MKNFIIKIKYRWWFIYYCWILDIPEMMFSKPRRNDKSVLKYEEVMVFLADWLTHQRMGRKLDFRKQQPLPTRDNWQPWIDELSNEINEHTVWQLKEMLRQICYFMGYDWIKRYDNPKILRNHYKEVVEAKEALKEIADKYKKVGL
jgi:hypothetical protein